MYLLWILLLKAHCDLQTCYLWYLLPTGECRCHISNSCPTQLKSPPVKVSVPPQHHFLFISFTTGFYVYGDTWKVLRRVQGRGLRSDCGTERDTCAPCNYPWFSSLLVLTLSPLLAFAPFIRCVFSHVSQKLPQQERALSHRVSSTSRHETPALTKTSGNNADTDRSGSNRRIPRGKQRALNAPQLWKQGARPAQGVLLPVEAALCSKEPS